MAARLTLSNTDYMLSLSVNDAWVELACLQGGASTLISAHDALNDVAIERAIDAAEDWLMPYAKSLRGHTLFIQDVAGNFGAGLRNVLNVGVRQFSVADIEDYFLQVLALVTRPSGLSTFRDQNFVATLVLVRELAHHGGLRSLQLLG